MGIIDSPPHYQGYPMTPQGRHTDPVWLTQRQHYLLFVLAGKLGLPMSRTVEVLVEANLRALGADPDVIVGSCGEEDKDPPGNHPRKSGRRDKR